MEVKKIKSNIIQAGRIAVEELIKVAKEPIMEFGPDLSADRLKNAAATKKLAIFDAFEILSRINEEQNIIDGKVEEETKKPKEFKGFAEGRSK
jgi:CO dehydrogenase/acetyl-CoA synthase epsilon subunit